MTEKESALYSHYIIDGVRLDMTPAELLDECMEDDGFIPDTSFSDIVDESTEPPLSAFRYDPDKENQYISQAAAASHEERPFGMLYPEHFTRLQIAKAVGNHRARHRDIRDARHRSAHHGYCCHATWGVATSREECCRVVTT